MILLLQLRSVPRRTMVQYFALLVTSVQLHECNEVLLIINKITLIVIIIIVVIVLIVVLTATATPEIPRFPVEGTYRAHTQTVSAKQAPARPLRV